jgi:nucleotide-binding universal stress UspA family protein
MYRKLIVPLDGSIKAEGVLPFVDDLTAKFNSEIILIGVSVVRTINVPRLLSTYIESIADKIRSKGIQVQAHLLPGNPGEEIINFSNNNRDGILIMASYGGSGSGHWLLGDLIGKITLRTVIPVLLIPEKRLSLDNLSSRFKRILVPLDTSLDGEVALPSAIELSKKASSKIFLLYVIPSIYKTYGLPDYAVNFEKQLFETLRIEGEKYLKNVTDNLTKENLETVFHVTAGTPAERIFTYAEEHLIDLIAISTHGRTGIKRFVLGSVARQVIFSTDIPVLLIRAKSDKIQADTSLKS